jgi:hypothetical protein
MTILHKVQMLRIKKCSDYMMWYRDMSGQLVPHLGWNALHGYKSRDAQGHTNFVLTDDAEPTAVHVHTNDLAHWPFNHYMHQATTQRKCVILAERDSKAWPRIVQSLGMASPAGSRHEPNKTQGQTRLQSAIEAMANIAIGWTLSLGVTAVVLPAFGHKVTMEENVYMTSIFTIVSLMRSYAVRRYFNYIHSQKKEQL